jgi:hypothetical protein
VTPPEETTSTAAPAGEAQAATAAPREAPAGPEGATAPPAAAEADAAPAEPADAPAPRGGTRRPPRRRQASRPATDTAGNDDGGSEA